MDYFLYVTPLQIQLAILITSLVTITVRLYSKRHAGEDSPVEKLTKYVLVGLGAFALLTYINFKPFSTQPHYWDMFHYYVGSKYFPELGYTRLYACVAKAESESDDPSIRSEAQKRYITNLNSINSVVPANLYFDDAYCKARFSNERWNAFKSDVSFFHINVDKVKGHKEWGTIQLDRGYNGTPVWALVGGAISNITPLSDSTLRGIALIDVLFLFGGVFCLIWAFGLTTASFAVILGTASSIADWSWLRGSELRLDWLFIAIISVCAMKRKHYVLAGAALGYAATLRIFPAVFALGPFVALVFAIYRRQYGSMMIYGRFFIGMAFSMSVLVVTATAVYGSGAMKEFVSNSRIHSDRVIMNNVGLRRVLTFDSSTSIRKAQEQHLDKKYAIEAWRTSTYEARKSVVPIYIAIVTISLLLFIPAAISGEPWLALAMGTTFVPFMWPDLSNYYYLFLMVMATIFAVSWKVAYPLLGIGILMNIGLLIGLMDDELYVLFSALICLGVLSIWWQIGSPLPFWRQVFSSFVARKA
jgi:hypothetical protein